MISTYPVINLASLYVCIKQRYSYSNEAVRWTLGKNIDIFLNPIIIIIIIMILARLLRPLFPWARSTARAS